MSYELQVYSSRPEPPDVEALLAQTGESGLTLELAGPPEQGPAGWSRLRIRSAGGSPEGFSVEVADRLDEMKSLLSEDADEGDEVPEQVLDAARLYVLELEDESDEASQAAFVVAAWGLATLTDAVIFDPQEGFFADAESFWGLIFDEEFADEALDEEDEGHEHGGGCCGGGGGGTFMPELPRGPGGTAR